MNDFEQKVNSLTGGGLYSKAIDTIQVNLGLRCNQECAHCHVAAGPSRTEVMEWPVMEQVFEALSSSHCTLVDLTGGAPELNPHFRRFIERLRAKDLSVQVRTNLTALVRPEMEGIMEFLREHEVQLVASLPCYLEENVRSQRGHGVYVKSIEAVTRLNALGYGSESGPALNLVYNPGGPFLPPVQASLEQSYRTELGNRFGIVFTRLLTITNMPIGRFQSLLRQRHQEKEYLQLLKDAFNPRTLEGLMCRHQLSIGWDGTLYDCDFNLALAYPVDHGAPGHISGFDPAILAVRRIATGDHCHGCTAGSGSSCAGALV